MYSELEASFDTTVSFELFGSWMENVRCIKRVDGKIVNIFEVEHSVWDTDDIRYLLIDRFHLPDETIDKAVQSYVNLIEDFFESYSD